MLRFIIYQSLDPCQAQVPPLLSDVEYLISPGTFVTVNLAFRVRFLPIPDLISGISQELATTICVGNGAAFE